MEPIFTCPLGSVCEEIKDNKLHRCRWYVCLAGKDPQSEKEIDEWGCAMEWMPLMMVEVAQTNRGQTQALCSMRDETVSRQEHHFKTMQETTRRISEAIFLKRHPVEEIEMVSCDDAIVVSQVGDDTKSEGTNA